MAAALNKTCASNYTPLPNGEQIEVLPQFKNQLPTSNSHPRPAFPQPYQRQNEDRVTVALINLSKICKDNQRYGGSPDGFFEDKFATFTENCNTVGLPAMRHHEAFHIMLEGAALQHYRTIVNQNNMIIPSISTLATEIKQFFEGKERETMLRSQWNETSLFSILAEHPESQKDVDKALTLLVQRLRHLQQGLSASYRSEEIFYGKLIDSCKDHPAKNIACSTTLRGDTSIDFINRAKANIST
ncbi:putative glycosyl [Golovinomyces cichoracearum]|uniref:Putative glycosyl n=1 Tax=Golovinomyces cichoracearum TaxID=62708 RepID=A0A420HIT1_9PEZI|nr:putative glycosyl [Golovinomyces cichoracearum]